MNYYHVDNGVITRRGPVVNKSKYTDAQGNLDEAAFNAAQAERNVYPEFTIEPTLQPWQRRGPQSLTFNALEKRVEITWPVEEIPLVDYKKRMRRQVLGDALSAIEDDHEQTVLILAALGVIPNGMIASIKADIQGTVTAAISKVQAIRPASTHADVLAARDA